MNVCYFCGTPNQLLYSEEKQVYVHSQCIVTKLAENNPVAYIIGREFEMVFDSQSPSCTVGCDECENRWCMKAPTSLSD